jgi:flagellar protein FliS
MTNPYLQQMVETATPVQLVGLLFRRGSELMDDAEAALNARDFERANDALVKAQRIVAELISSLDMEKGGEIATNLHRLYTFVWERLLHANLRKAVEPLQEAKTIWRELQSLWEMCDLDGDGTKEIVAVLDLKGQSDLRALAVYQLNGRRYQKVAQYRLPNEPALPYPDLAAVVPTPQGCVIAIERSNDKVLFFRYWQDKFHLIGQVVGVTPVGYSKVGTDLFVTDLKERWLLSLLFQRLPSKLRIQLANIFGSESRPITKVVSWDGKQLRSTRTLPGEGGGIQNALWQDVLWDEWVTGRTSLGNWVLLGEPIRWKLWHGEEIPTLARYRLFLGANGRYRSIWHIHTTVTEEGFPQAFPADLDGDGADELVLVDTVKGKLQVFKIQ